MEKHSLKEIIGLLKDRMRKSRRRKINRHIAFHATATNKYLLRDGAEDDGEAGEDDPSDEAPRKRLCISRFHGYGHMKLEQKDFDMLHDRSVSLPLTMQIHL